MNRIGRLTMAAIFATLFAPLGCDDRATQVAIDAADRQAAQNEEFSRLSREHASARRELLELHQQVQTERQALSSGWQELHAEQEGLTQERRTESFLKLLVPVAFAAIAVWLLKDLVRRRFDQQMMVTLLSNERQTSAAALQRIKKEGTLQIENRHKEEEMP